MAKSAAPKGNKRALGNKGGPGRESLYKEAYAEQAYKLLLLDKSYTDARLAEFFEVGETTIARWKLANPEFADALARGKDIADAEVVNALRQRAMGYTHDDEDIRTITLPDNGGSEIVRTAIKKHYPPDAASALFWLKNRNQKNWRDKQEVEHTGPGGGPIQNVNMTPAEFSQIAKQAATDV